MFKSFDDMPQSLKAHVRYPEDLLTIQSHIYAIYHMADPGVFYNREDAWEVSKVANNDRGSAAHHTLLPDFEIARFRQGGICPYATILPLQHRQEQSEEQYGIHDHGAV